MPTTCSQCNEDIGGHAPKCVIKGQWWCEACIYWLERNMQSADAFEEFCAAVDNYHVIKRRAAQAAGEDV